MSLPHVVETAPEKRGLLGTWPAFLQDSDLKLILLGGKGGVGKTTCAAATALRLAIQSPDRRFLIASTDPAHSLEDSFADSRLPPNLEFIEIDSQETLRKFKDAHAQQLRKIALRGTFLDDDDVSRLLDLSMPGLDEVMAFSEIADLVETQAYSCIVLDTAATGHTLRLLGLPAIIRKWVGALDAMLAKHRYMAKLYRGFYRRDDTDVFLLELARSIDSLGSLLSNPRECRFVPVMLAEALSRSETSRLVDELERLKIPLTEVLVNRLYRGRAGCPMCLDRQGGQERELGTSCHAFGGYLLWGVPQQGAEVRGVDQLVTFWDRVFPLAPPNGRPPEASVTCGVGAVLPRVQGPADLPSADTSLLLFAGKGGVGKTTLASATALRLAHEYPSQRVLLFSTDPAHSLSACLGTEIGPQEVQLCAGLTAMEIDAEAEFEQVKKQYADEVEKFFGSLTGSGMVDLEFDREVIERMLDLSPPGLDEVMALTCAVDLLERDQYDIFVFDTAPTGHLVRLLELPELIQDWLKAFFGLFLKYRNVFRLPKISALMVAMSKRLKILEALLAEPGQSTLCIVSIPTEMALAESCDLFEACQRLGIEVSTVLLNLVTPRGECPLCDELGQKELTVSERSEAAFRGAHQTVVFRCAEPRGLERLAKLGDALYVKRDTRVAEVAKAPG